MITRRRPLARGTAASPSSSPDHQPPSDASSTSPRREPPTEAQMLEVVRKDIYPRPRYTVFSQVRSSVGLDVPELGIADAVVVDTKEGLGITYHALEVKRSRTDYRREREDPAKALRVGRYCETFELVVPWPASTYLGSFSLVPPNWGIIEVEGKRARRLQWPGKRPPDPAPDGFIKALYRSADAAAAKGRDAPELPVLEGAKPRAIGGRIDKQWVWFEGCLHRQMVPLLKRSPAPTRALCLSCAERLPPHPEAVKAALEEAEHATLQKLRDHIDSLLRGRRSA